MTTTALPRVTVLMPVHNAARYVGDAMRSVLAQTFADFELVVVDDGSTDASAAIVASFDDPRVRLVRNEHNLGLTPSLNRGLSLARGDLVARLDADDVAEAARLARQVAFLDAHPDVAVVGSWYRKIDEHGRAIGDRELPLGDAQLRWALVYCCPIVHSAATFRRDAIRALGGYDERLAYAQDFDLWSRVARRYQIANVPDFLVRYRVLSTSLTAMIGESSGEGAATSLANARALMRAAGGAEPSAPEHAETCTLLLGGPLIAGSAAVAEAFARVLRLLDAFCAQPQLSSESASAVRDDVLRFLRRRFVRSLDYFAPPDFERVATLLYGERSWYRLIGRRPIRSAVALVGRSRLGRALERRPERR